MIMMARVLDFICGDGNAVMKTMMMITVVIMVDVIIVLQNNVYWNVI